MHKHVLIPVALDHEGIAQRKIAMARRVMVDGGRITLLTVLESVPGFVAEFVDMKGENHLTQSIKAKLDQVADGAPDIDTVVMTGKAGVRVSEYARQHEVDLIIVGSHQPNATDYFLGSTAARVARRAPCSVYILR